MRKSQGNGRLGIQPIAILPYNTHVPLVHVLLSIESTRVPWHVLLPCSIARIPTTWSVVLNTRDLEWAGRARSAQGREGEEEGSRPGALLLVQLPTTS